MKLNKNLKLVLQNVYLYDIEACHYTILNNLGYDLTGIDPNDKLGRNIEIGKMMKKNPRLISLLRNTTESVINDYISKNNILEDDIVIRQYDGLLLTRKIQHTNIGHIPLECRKTFEIFISSINRNKYIALDQTSKVAIKGVSNRYEYMDNLYLKLCKIVALAIKESIFRNLQRIKDEIINGNKPEMYAVPNRRNKFTIFLKDYGEIEVSKSTIRIMDPSEIDRNKYFQYYIEPFTKSIVYGLVR